MPNYQVSFVSDVTLSTPYTGKLAIDGSVAIYATGLTGAKVMQQQVYGDADTTPLPPSGETLVSSMITSFVPRLGENIGMPALLGSTVASYTPPTLALIPFNGGVPQVVSSNILPNAFMYPTSTSTFYVRSKIWMLKAVVDAMGSTGNAAAVGDSGIFSSYITPILAQLATYAFSAWSVVPVAPTTLTGTNIYNATIGAVALTAGSTTAGTDTFILCFGDVTLNTIVCGTGNRVVVVATRDITITNSPIIGGKVLLVAGRNLSVGGSTTLPPGMTVAAVGTSSGFTGASATTSLFQWRDTTGAQIASFAAPTVAPGLMTYTVSSSAQPVAKITQFEQVDTDNTFPSVAVMPLSDSYYMMANNGTNVINATQMLAALVLQTANQAGLSFTAVTSGTHTNGSYEIKSNIDGRLHISKVVVQKNASSLPNAGVHTEAFCFDKYAFTMAQTYKATEDGWVFYKTGRYFTLSATNEIVISSSNLTLPPLPYDLIDSTATTAITSICSVSLSDTFVGGAVSTTANQGGMDPYTLQTDGSWKSKYRRLTTLGATAGTVLFVKAPYEDHIRYAPRGGTVLDSSNAPVESFLVRNTNRRSGIVVAQCQIAASKTSQAGFTTLLAAQNVARNFQATGVVFVYVDATVIRFLVNEKLYSIATGASKLIGSTTYSYAATSTVGSFSTGSTVTQTFTLTTTAVTPSTVTLVVYFSDMVEATLLDGDREVTEELFEYFTRVVDGIVPHYLAPRIVLGTENSVDVTFRTVDEVNALVQAGFEIDAKKENEYRIAYRTETQGDPAVVDDLQLYGLATLDYTQGATLVTTPILPGTYTSDDTVPKTIVVDSNQQVDLASFPFSLNLKTYKARAVSAPPGAIVLATATDLLTTLQAKGTAGFSIMAASPRLQLETYYIQGKLNLTSITLLAGTAPAQMTIADAESGEFRTYRVA